MELADKKRMARRILGDYPDEYLTMLEFIDRYPDLQETPAQFQERCGQVALRCFWKEQQGDGETPAVREYVYTEPTEEEKRRGDDDDDADGMDGGFREGRESREGRDGREGREGMDR